MATIITNTKNIRHKDKTLDKVLDNIKPDGSVIASKTQLGNVKIGDNIDVDNQGKISIPFASAEYAGVARLSGEPITEETAPNYSAVSSYGGTAMVRKADSDNYGVVKIGNGLNVDDNGSIGTTVKPTKYLSAATPSYAAEVKVFQSTGSSHGNDGKLYIEPASSSNRGVISVSESFLVDNGALKLNAQSILLENSSSSHSNFTFEESATNPGKYIITLKNSTTSTNIRNFIKNNKNLSMLYLAIHDDYYDPKVKLNLIGFSMEIGNMISGTSNYKITLKHGDYIIEGASLYLSLVDIYTIFKCYPIA